MSNRRPRLIRMNRGDRPDGALSPEQYLEMASEMSEELRELEERREELMRERARVRDAANGTGMRDRSQAAASEYQRTQNIISMLDEAARQARDTQNGVQQVMQMHERLYNEHGEEFRRQSVIKMHTLPGGRPDMTVYTDQVRSSASPDIVINDVHNLPQRQQHEPVPEIAASISSTMREIQETGHYPTLEDQLAGRGPVHDTRRTPNETRDYMREFVRELVRRNR